MATLVSAKQIERQRLQLLRNFVQRQVSINVEEVWTTVERVIATRSIGSKVREHALCCTAYWCIHLCTAIRNMC